MSLEQLENTAEDIPDDKNAGKILEGKRNVKRKSIKFFAGDACRYPVVREAAQRLGWKLINEAASEKVKRSCNVLWIDTSNVQNYLNAIQPWQRINHFPGMINIARKTRLAENLEMMKKEFKDEYDFFPTTFIVPRDLSAIKSYFDSSGRSRCTFIVKPDGGCQGKGIFLTKDLETIEGLKTTHVAQRYIANPLLINGKKFDLRIYVLVTSCDPLRMYLFKDGLVRLCTEDFTKPNASNMDDKTMHLTNFSINKKSDQFEGSLNENGDTGSKRGIKWFLSWLSDKEGPQVATDLWRNIGDICVKTVLSIAPTLSREYRSTFGLGQTQEVTESSSCRAACSEFNCDACDLKVNPAKEMVSGSRCFAILGVDVMIDSDFKAHLIEVNHLPSFATGSKLDEAIKSKVCYQALSALKCESSDQQNHETIEKKKRAERILRNRNNNHHKSSGPSYSSEKYDLPVSQELNRSVEEMITDIYTKYAPQKLQKIDALMKKYRGYEDWLLKRLEEKYISSSYEGEVDNQQDIPDDDSTSSSESNDITCNNNRNKYHSDIESAEEHNFLVENGDYDRIYPPVDESKFLKYQRMIDHAGDYDCKEQKRLTCPLWLQRQHGRQDDVDASLPRNERLYAAPSRGDWMFHGNIHIQKREVTTKVIQPPSQRQIEAADRLSKGFSVEDREGVGSSLNEGNITEPFVNRLSKAVEVGRQCRKRNDAKFMPKTRLQMNPITLSLPNPDEIGNITAGYFDKGERYYVDFAGRKLG